MHAGGITPSTGCQARILYMYHMPHITCAAGQLKILWIDSVGSVYIPWNA